MRSNDDLLSVQGEVYTLVDGEGYLVRLRMLLPKWNNHILRRTDKKSIEENRSKF